MPNRKITEKDLDWVSEPKEMERLARLLIDPAEAYYLLGFTEKRQKELTLKQKQNFEAYFLQIRKRLKGRVNSILDWEQIDAMCAIQCTIEEMVAVLRTERKTLERRALTLFGLDFSAYCRVRGSKGKVSLRRWQYELAQKGNATMQIWLGKNVLNQTDKIEQKTTVVTVDAEDKILDDCTTAVT